MRKRLAAVAFAGALAACGSRGTAQPTPAPSAASLPSPSVTPIAVRVHGAGSAGNPTVLSETKGGRRIYTVRALSFEGTNVGGGVNTGSAVLEQPHITFLDRSGKPTIADAPKAHVTERDKSILMTGGVHARTSDGIVMTCDTLRYDGNTERFVGVGNVVLTGSNGLSLSGDRLDGDVRLQDVKVTRGAG